MHIRTLARAVRLGALVLSLSALTACAGTGGATQEAPEAAGGTSIVNAKCPVMGGDVDPAGETVSWNGHTIGFCCPGCSDGWNAKSDAEKAAFIESCSHN